MGIRGGGDYRGRIQILQWILVCKAPAALLELLQMEVLRSCRAFLGCQLKLLC